MMAKKKKKNLQSLTHFDSRESQSQKPISSITKGNPSLVLFLFVNPSFIGIVLTINKVFSNSLLYCIPN
jgi:hypothetical protein